MAEHFEFIQKSLTEDEFKVCVSFWTCVKKYCIYVFNTYSIFAVDRSRSEMLVICFYSYVAYVGKIPALSNGLPNTKQIISKVWWNSVMMTLPSHPWNFTWRLNLTVWKGMSFQTLLFGVLYLCQISGVYNGGKEVGLNSISDNFQRLHDVIMSGIWFRTLPLILYSGGLALRIYSTDVLNILFAHYQIFE